MTGGKVSGPGVELLAEVARALETTSSITSGVSEKKPGSGAGMGLGWGRKNWDIRPWLTSMGVHALVSMGD